MTLTNAWQSVDDYLTGTLSVEDPDVESPPLADGDEANRTLRRVRRIRADRDAELEVARIELERLQGYIANRTEHWAVAEQFHVDRLARYHAAVLVDDPARKTIRLPEGTLTARVQQPEWVYDDESSFLVWAQDNAPSVVRPPKPGECSIDKAEAKKLLVLRDEKDRVVRFGVHPDTLEVPPGLTVVARGPKHDIDLTDPLTAGDTDA